MGGRGGSPRAWPSIMLPEGERWEEGSLSVWTSHFCTRDAARAALCRASWGQPQDPSCSLPARPPSGRWAPLQSQDQSDQAPAAPSHPGTRLCAPLKTDSIPCPEVPAGGRCPHWRRNRAQDTWAYYVSLVFPLDFGDHIPAFLLLHSSPHRQAGTWPCGERAGGLPGLKHSRNREGEAPTKPSLAG